MERMLAAAEIDVLAGPAAKLMILHISANRAEESACVRRSDVI